MVMKIKTGVSPLDRFILYYEEMEFIKVKKPNESKVLANRTDSTKKKVNNTTVSLKSRILSKLTPVRAYFNNIIKRLKPHRKTAKKVTKIEQKRIRDERLRGILGIGLLFVVVSIAYSSYVIYNGVSSTASRVMLVPQVVFALLTLIKAFSKIYK